MLRKHQHTASRTCTFAGVWKKSCCSAPIGTRFQETKDFWTARLLDSAIHINHLTFRNPAKESMHDQHPNKVSLVSGLCHHLSVQDLVVEWGQWNQFPLHYVSIFSKPVSKNLSLEFTNDKSLMPLFHNWEVQSAKCMSVTWYSTFGTITRD